MSVVENNVGCFRMRRGPASARTHAERLGIEVSEDAHFVKERQIDFDDALAMMKRAVRKPWAWHEDEDRLYVFRMSPPRDELPPVCTDMLSVDKQAR